MALGSNSISLNGLSKNSDALLAIGVVGVLMILVVPLPEVVLDLLIALSITVGVLILLFHFLQQMRWSFRLFQQSSLSTLFAYL